MPRLLVAEYFVWDEYPGLRAGKLYAGKGEIAKRPRAQFPNEFSEPVVLRAADLCASCGLDREA